MSTGGDHIKISIHDQQLRALLDQLEARLKNPHLLMRKIAGILMDEVEENFATEGKNNGAKWESLSKKTIKQREAKGYWPGKILQQRGELAATVTSKSDASRAIVGSNKRYAAIHQLGGKAGRGRKVEIPARDYLSPSTGGINQVKRAVVNFIEGR